MGPTFGTHALNGRRLGGPIPPRGPRPRGVTGTDPTMPPAWQAAASPAPRHRFPYRARAGARPA